MVDGVTTGYRKGIEITGVGYRAQKVGNKLQLNLGYSHPIEIDPPAGHHASRSRTRPGSPSSASTRSSSARSPPGSAPRASRSRTRARASATPASRSAARRARPARSAGRSSDPDRQPQRGTREAPRAHPPAPRGHDRAAAPRGVPQPQPHLRPGDRRLVGPNARRGVHPREGASRRRSRPRPRRLASSADSSPSGRRPPASNVSSSIGPASGTTGGSSRLPTPPARPVSTSDAKRRRG